MNPTPQQPKTAELHQRIQSAIVDLVATSLAAQRYWSAGAPCQTAAQINGGNCEEFARDVFDALGWDDDTPCADIIEYANLTGVAGQMADGVFRAATLRKFGVPVPPRDVLRDLNASTLGETGSHTFIRCGDRYFDAECPAGVDSPFELPFAQRYLQGYRQSLAQQLACIDSKR